MLRKPRGIARPHSRPHLEADVVRRYPARRCKTYRGTRTQPESTSYHYLQRGKSRSVQCTSRCRHQAPAGPEHCTLRGRHPRNVVRNSDCRNKSPAHSTQRVPAGCALGRTRGSASFVLPLARSAGLSVPRRLGTPWVAAAEARGATAPAQSCAELRSAARATPRRTVFATGAAPHLSQAVPAGEDSTAH